MKKNILITGGTRGIGLGIATELAKGGHNLILNGTRPQKDVEATLTALGSFGSEVIYCRGDISSGSDRRNLVSRSLAHFGQLNGLVNNAGVSPSQRLDLLKTTEESFDRVMSINLKGPFFLTQLVANHLTEMSSRDKEFQACIINISSISAFTASVTRSEYCISKAGLSMVTKLYAARLGTHSIPVYELQPGIILTDMTAPVLDKYQELIHDGSLIEPRFGTPEDVGRIVQALVEGTLPYTTGNVIRVDGGLTLSRL